MNKTNYGGSSFTTPRKMLLAMIADFVSAGGQNSRCQVEGFLADWQGTLQEYNEEARPYLEEHQEDAYEYHMDREHSPITAEEVLEALYG